MKPLTTIDFFGDVAQPPSAMGTCVKAAKAQLGCALLTECLRFTEELCGWGSLLSELRFKISSYLDTPSLRAARATSREGSSTEEFVACLVQLLEPRLSVFMACFDVYSISDDPPDLKTILEREQALAEKNFQLFAREQGFTCLFFMDSTTVNRWWDTSQLALTGVVKSLVQHSSEEPIRRLTLDLVRCNIDEMKGKGGKGYKRFLGEQLLAVLCYCSNYELRRACIPLKMLAEDCQDPDLAQHCIEALVEVWQKLRQDPPELLWPATTALAAWTTNFPEHSQRIRDMGVAL